MPIAPPGTPSSAPLLTFDRILDIAIGITLAAVSIVIAIRWKRRLPCYAILANNLLQDHTVRLPALDVRFSGVAVQSLTVARVAIWNDGRETIHGKHVAEADPLALVTPESVRILNARLIQFNSLPSEMLLEEIARNEVRVTFEFLNHRKGSVIEVVHTGTSANDLTVRGSIQDASRIRRVNVAEQAKRILSRSQERRELGPIVGALGIFIVVAVILIRFVPKTWTYMSWAAGAGLGLGLGAALARLCVDLLRSAFLPTLPRGLEKIAEGLFEDEAREGQPKGSSSRGKGER